VEAMEFPKIQKEIYNPINENVKKLAELFPSAVRDGQVDFEALKKELGEFEAVSDKLSERYELGWAGKEEAKQLANTDVVGKTLKYIPEDSKNPDTTGNLYIEGDNLEVLKLLRNSYYNKIKMIYIDIITTKIIQFNYPVLQAS
jgi:adenine-specific DNA-methyltransferase